MEYKNTFITNELDESLCRTFLSFIITILHKYGIKEIDIAFKYAWGNEINNWEYFKIKSTEIKSKVENAEKEGLGYLGEDDLFLLIDTFDAEIQFCHHSDLHFGFNEKNDFVKDILNFWEEYNIAFDS